jgi:hypothetical protein
MKIKAHALIIITTPLPPPNKKKLEQTDSD